MHVCMYVLFINKSNRRKKEDINLYLHMNTIVGSIDYIAQTLIHDSSYTRKKYGDISYATLHLR